MKDQIDRVLEKIVKIPEAGCWIFMGALNESGYGIVGKGGRGAGNDRAHRITYKHFKGEIPDGIFVCHRCDVPACCNPEHLFLGTNSENMEDCRKKGRASKPPVNSHLKGEGHYAAKVNEKIVLEMRRMRNDGATFQQIADAYSVSCVNAYKIVTKLSWKHI